MQRSFTTLFYTASGLALTTMLAGCAAPGGGPLAYEGSFTFGSTVVPRSLIADAMATAPQDDIPSMDQVHPRTMITLGLAVGEQTNEVNTGGFANQVLTSEADAYRFRVRAEHFFESGFGLFGEVYSGVADDINLDRGSADSSQDSMGVFLAAAFRGTIDDDFRLPVRFGPFIQTTEVEDVNFVDGAIERSTIGVRLSAEPEFILVQSNRGGKIAELSVFGEIRVGAGPANVEDDVDKEDGYAFTLDWEVGLRYRFRQGLLMGLSYVASKYHVGTTESYNNAVFFGIDDDFNGLLFTLGFRH